MSTLLPNRREFLEGSAATVAGLALCGTANSATTQAVRVRRNFGRLNPALPEDLKVINGYVEGVRVLKARSSVNWNDVRGWAVQAGLHMNRCQHGNWWFLPWHRGYLHFFERMIQDAIGDPLFALPYWDWSDPAQTALPAAFRNAASPLFDARRRTTVNSGASRLNWSGYPNGNVFNYVMNIPNYVPALSSPAANSFPGLERTHGPDLGHGSLEGGPHDYVHVWVAGQSQRDMGDPVYAALDPIFWLHHCNIDRLWTRWLTARPGRSHPTNSTWRSQSFQFLAPNGTSASISVAQVLDTRAMPLNYRYDDEPMAPPAPLLAAAAEEPRPMTIRSARIDAHDAPALAVAQPRYEVGERPLTVAIPIAPKALDRVKAARAAVAEGPGERPGVVLAIEEVAFEEGATGQVAVYLNAPVDEQGRVDPTKGEFLGTIALFGGHGGGHAPMAAQAADAPPVADDFPPVPKDDDPVAAMAMAMAPPRVTRVFDVSVPLLEAPIAPGKGELPAPAPALKVTFVRLPLDADAPEAPLKGQVTFARAALRTNE